MLTEPTKLNADEPAKRVAVLGATGSAGRCVVAALRAGGHEVLALSRRTGVDVVTGGGLAAAFEGVEVVIDATNFPGAGRKKEPTASIFAGAARRVQDTAAALGVRRVVVLSIVGTARAPYGYYQAKVEQEEAYRRGPLPVTVVRSTQFFDLPWKLAQRARLGPFALAPRMLVQPVAAPVAGELLARVATSPAPPAEAEIAGPCTEYLPDMAQAIYRRLGERVTVLPFSLRGEAGPAVQSGALLPGQGVPLSGPTFAQWLEGDDPVSMLL